MCEAHKPEKYPTYTKDGYMNAKKANLKTRLSNIKTPEEFEHIFNQEFALFVGSPKRCVETLAGLMPRQKEKQEIIRKATPSIIKRFPGNRWFYSGD